MCIYIYILSRVVNRERDFQNANNLQALIMRRKKIPAKYYETDYETDSRSACDGMASNIVVIYGANALACTKTQRLIMRQAPSTQKSTVFL